MDGRILRLLSLHVHFLEIDRDKKPQGRFGISASHFVPRCQTWHRNASNIQVWECPSGRRANFISIRQTSSGIFQIFQIFSVINSNYVFSRPWRYSQRYWAWGTSSKPVRKLAPPKRTGISAHSFFLFFNVSFIDPFARGKMRILAWMKFNADRFAGRKRAGSLNKHIKRLSDSAAKSSEKLFN